MKIEVSPLLCCCCCVQLRCCYAIASHGGRDLCAHSMAHSVKISQTSFAEKNKLFTRIFFWQLAKVTKTRAALFSHYKNPHVGPSRLAIEKQQPPKSQLTDSYNFIIQLNKVSCSSFIHLLGFIGLLVDMWLGCRLDSCAVQTSINNLKDDS